MLTRLVKRFYRWRKWSCPYCRKEPMSTFEFLVNMRRYMGGGFKAKRYVYTTAAVYDMAGYDTRKVVSAELRKDLASEGKPEHKEQCRCI